MNMMDGDDNGAGAANRGGYECFSCSQAHGLVMDRQLDVFLDGSLSWSKLR